MDKIMRRETQLLFFPEVRIAITNLKLLDFLQIVKWFSGANFSIADRGDKISMRYQQHGIIVSDDSQIITDGTTKEQKTPGGWVPGVPFKPAYVSRNGLLFEQNLGDKYPIRCSDPDKIQSPG